METSAQNERSPTTVSLSGVDNVGKTTQLSYLPDIFEVRGGLHEYDAFMGDLTKDHKLKEWWFNGSSSEEFVSVIQNAVNRRAALPSTKKLTIFDRGGTMFEAVCIATLAVKQSCSLLEAQKTYGSIMENLGLTVRLENIRILLVHGGTINESLKTSLSREEQYDERYETYQKLLHQQVTIQEGVNKYTHTIDVTNLSVIQVQNEIRLIIRTAVSGSELEGQLLPMFQNLDAIVGFGGLSESGKSSLAEGTCRKLEDFGIKCTRLKIAYFMESASEKLGCDVYSLPESEQARLLVKEIDHYARRQYWNRALTIESLHRLESTRILQLILGELLQIVYVETSFRNRLVRSHSDLERILEKDTVKKQRGADKIKSLPGCFVLDENNLTVDEAVSKVYDMIRSKNLNIRTQTALSNVYTGKVNLLSQQFVLSAGSVLIHKTKGEICLINSLEGKKEWLLPKGRKNVGESLEAAAVRETYEETGHACSLMPLSMETRATRNDLDADDFARIVEGSCEPLMVSLRRIGGNEHNQKLIFWYATQVDEERDRNNTSQMSNENFGVKFFPLEEACDLLSHAEDKELVRKAYDLYSRQHRT